MNKAALKEAMIRHVGGAHFIRKYELAQFMDMKDPNTCNRYLAALERVGKDYYFIPDVVEAIIERQGEI